MRASTDSKDAQSQIKEIKRKVVHDESEFP